MEEQIRIRIAKPQDAEELLAIYAPYVTETAITFEYTVPDTAEFTRRIRTTLGKYPYLAAECAGEIVGYAYTGPFKGRAAYDWAVETTVYVRKDRKKQGIGKRLYDALEQISKLQHVTNMNACIGVPETEDAYLTRNSMDFHAHMGYRLVGEFYGCGYKFGHWYNMVWMEKIIGEHISEPEAVIPFPMLKDDVLQRITAE